MSKEVRRAVVRACTIRLRAGDGVGERAGDEREDCDGESVQGEGGGRDAGMCMTAGMERGIDARPRRTRSSVADVNSASARTTRCRREVQMSR